MMGGSSFRAAGINPRAAIHSGMLDQDQQADADTDTDTESETKEIDITPEMIEAGMDAYADYHADLQIEEAGNPAKVERRMVSAVFRATSAAQKF